MPMRKRTGARPSFRRWELSRSTARRIASYGEVPWIVGAHVSVDIVNTEFRRLMTAGLAGLAVLAIAILAALVLGHGIARPIKRLAAGAGRIARLELADVPTQPASHIRELNDQANAFNAMLSGLRWLETYVPLPVEPVDFVPRALGYGYVQPGKVWEAVAEVSGKIAYRHPELERGRLLPEATEISLCEA